MKKNIAFPAIMGFVSMLAAAGCGSSLSTDVEPDTKGVIEPEQITESLPLRVRVADAEIREAHRALQQQFCRRYRRLKGFPVRWDTPASFSPIPHWFAKALHVRPPAPQRSSGYRHRGALGASTGAVERQIVSDP